jgi:hypothetical protein
MQTDPKIVLPDPHTMQTKIQNKLNALNALTKNLTKEQKFKYIHGFGENGENMFYIYLFKKYKTKCFVRDRRFGSESLGMRIDIYHKFNKQHHLFNNYDNKAINANIADMKLHIDVIADELVNCIKNRNIDINIIPIGINNGSKGSHANILIYRKKFNHIEHFEPHGKGVNGIKLDDLNKQIDKMLNYFVSKVNEKLKTTKETEIKLIKSSTVCPRVAGLQELEGESKLDILEGEPIGYCVAWSFFFAELCLANPEFPSSELLTYIYNVLDSMGRTEQRNYLRNMIRGYSIIINEKIEKYFSILYNNNLSVYKNLAKDTDVFRRTVAERPTKINMDTKDVLNSFIAIELNLSISPTYLDKRIQQIKKEIDDQRAGATDLIKLKKELEVLELYKSFDEIKSDTMSSIQPNLLQQPQQKEPTLQQKEPTPTQKQELQQKEPTPTQKQELQQKEPTPTQKCPEGKEINPLTGRCIKIKTLKTVVKTNKTATQKCPEGKEINPLTGRCIKIKTLKTVVKTNKTATKKCPEGKEINPKTGRCIKIK